MLTLKIKYARHDNISQYNNVIKLSLHNNKFVNYKNVVLCRNSTVGENIIATTKIRNNYGAIQSFNFSLLPLVQLSLLILFASFLVSVLFFFFDDSLSKVIALPTIALSRS
jgi:hypothetical protein